MGATYGLGIGWGKCERVKEFLLLGLTDEVITEMIDGELYDCYLKNGEIVIEPTMTCCNEAFQQEIEENSGGSASWEMIDGICELNVPGYKGSEMTIDRPGSVFDGKSVGSLDLAVGTIKGMLEEAKDENSYLHKDLMFLEEMYRAAEVADKLYVVFCCC